jgi:hypothetical protein
VLHTIDNIARGKRAILGYVQKATLVRRTDGETLANCHTVLAVLSGAALFCKWYVECRIGDTGIILEILASYWRYWHHIGDTGVVLEILAFVFDRSTTKLRYRRSMTSEPRLDPARGYVSGESMSWTNPDGFGPIHLMVTASQMA